MTRLLMLVCGLVLFASTAAMAADCPRTTVADLEDEVMCPVCGTSLGVAREAPLARRERAMIERLANRCQTKAQIKAALVGEFGPAVLAMPPRQGFDASAYLVPGAGALAALLVAALLLRRWRRRGASSALAPTTALTAADQLDLEAELARLR